MSKDSMVRSHTRNIFGVDDERDKMQEQISRLSIINDAMNGGSTDGEEDGSIVTIIVDFKDELRGVANLAKHNSSVMEVKHEIVSNLSTSLGVSISESERTSGTDENIFGRGIYALDNSFGIVTRLSGKDAVKEITEKIENCFSEYYFMEGVPLKFSPSIGICFPEMLVDSRDAISLMEEVLRNAPEKNGKGFGESLNFYVVDKNDRVKFNRRKTIETEMRKYCHDLSFPGFETYGQLQVGLREGFPLRGYEILLRWNSSLLRNVTPNEFIPVAERYPEIMKKLSLWVIENSFKERVKISDGQDINLGKLAINFSPCQFNDLSLVERILEISDRTGFPLSDLEIEITERTAMSDYVRTKDIMYALHERDSKLSVALDDYGQGHNTIGVLRDLPFLNTLKIDMGLLRNISNSGYYLVNPQGKKNHDYIIFKSIVEMACNMDMDVVIEGVENQDQINFLLNEFIYKKERPKKERNMFDKRLILQGYQISRPKPVSELVVEAVQKPFLETTKYQSKEEIDLWHREYMEKKFSS